MAEGGLQGDRADLSGLPVAHRADRGRRCAEGSAGAGPQWALPQPVITKDNLATYVDPKMPPLFYAACGCSDLPGYPERWGGKK